MSYIIVDVESDGPIPNKYSMQKGKNSIAKQRHDHTPVNDAIGNADPLLSMKMGLRYRRGK